VRTFGLAVFTALLVAPTTVFGSSHSFAALPAVIPVTMPEYWGASDSLGFFAVALGIFAVLVRLKVLRPSSRDEK
jgi:hypothetical protein